MNTGGVGERLWLSRANCLDSVIYGTDTRGKPETGGRICRSSGIENHDLTPYQAPRVKVFYLANRIGTAAKVREFST